MAKGSEYDVSIVTEKKTGSRERIACSVACLKNGSRSVDSSQMDGGGSVSSGFIAFLFAFRANDRVVTSRMKRVASSDPGKAHVKRLEQIKALEALERVLRAGWVKSAPGIGSEDQLLQGGNQSIGLNDQHEGEGE